MIELMSNCRACKIGSEVSRKKLEVLSIESAAVGAYMVGLAEGIADSKDVRTIMCPFHLDMLSTEMARYGCTIK